MTNTKRYDLADQGDTALTVFPDGAYVRWEDFERLDADAAGVQAELASVKQYHQAQWDLKNQQVDQLERDLRCANAALVRHGVGEMIPGNSPMNDPEPSAFEQSSPRAYVDGLAPEPVSAPSAWMNAEGLVSAASGGGYDIPLYPGAAEKSPANPPHTTEDDFQHYLSYSGKRGQNEADLRLAYYAAADAGPPVKSEAPLGSREREAYEAELKRLRDCLASRTGEQR